MIKKKENGTSNTGRKMIDLLFVYLSNVSADEFYLTFCSRQKKSTDYK